jgi:hypothetical protein
VHKQQRIQSKPRYFNGQLLLEDDFVAEQEYHSFAHCGHLKNMHGFGVAHGLEVTPAGETAVSVSSGFAVDRKGQEIELRKPETLELLDLPAGALAWVTIGFRTEQIDPGSNQARIDCYAYLRAATGVDEDDVRLASVQIDGRGLLAEDAISNLERDQMSTAILPGSVTAEALSAELRRGWIAMTFKPYSLPQDEAKAQPPFRIGASRAVAHKQYDGVPNERGAAGTMNIVLPPGVRHIHRLRVAGEENEKNIKLTLVKGGFDSQAMAHLRDEIVKMQIGSGSYCETADIPEEHQSMADPYRTLSVEVRAKGFVSVSLLAIEVSY